MPSLPSIQSLDSVAFVGYIYHHLNECKRNLFILCFSKEVGVITTRAGVINKAGDTEKMIQNDLIASKSS